MGGEKFFNIKCFYSGLTPSCAIIVSTVRSTKLHGGAPKVVAGAKLDKAYTEENLDLVRKGSVNLVAHINNVLAHGVRPVVAINRFKDDTDSELALLGQIAREAGAYAAVEAEHFSKGGAGAAALGRAVMEACEGADKASFRHIYDAKTQGIKAKIHAIVTKVYGGKGVLYSEAAEARIAQYDKDPAFASLPVCMSKTQYSLSDDPTKLGAPTGFEVTVKDIYASAGAGFLVVSLGAISFIPGLPIKPAYYKIDLDLTTNPPKVVGLS